MTTITAGTKRPDPGKAKGKASGKDVQGTGRLAAMLLSPTLIVLALVVGYPIIKALHDSLYQQGQGLDANGFVVKGDKFVGLKNYTAIFSGDNGTAFWNAFWNTSFFTVTTVIIETILGVTMAMVMHKAFKGRGFVRASILIPWAIPTAVSALLWKWIFQSDGVANAVIGTKVLWTTEGFHAKLAVIIADTWKTAPLIGLLVLAGLQTIPSEVYEAAKVDGASAAQTFWRITLPLIKPVLLIAVLFRLLDVLRMFDLPYVLIGDHKDSVETLSILAFNEAGSLRFGPAAAYATILFVYVALVAYAFVKLLGADVIGQMRSGSKAAPAKKKEAPVRVRQEVAA